MTWPYNQPEEPSDDWPEDDGMPFEEDLEWVTDDPVFPKGAYVQVGDVQVAWVVRYVKGEFVSCCMVGDDHWSLVHRDHLQPVKREDFCGQCGQMGCGHDGLERE